MAMTHKSASVVGVFNDHAQAQRAVNDLKRAGFTDDQIGVVGRHSDGTTTDTTESSESYAGEGAATGLAAGAGIGALWGLGILAGAIPAIGPAIAGGTLAVLLSSAAAGAAAAGIAGTLIGMGIPKEEAEYYESEFKAGRVLVTVSATGREDEARAILRRNGGYDSTNRSATTTSASATATGMHSSIGASGGSSTAASRTGSGGTVKAVEEELHVKKRPVESEVSVHKEVHHEQRTIDVPVTREEVVVERHAPSNKTASSADMGQQQEIRVPVKEEHVSVEKTPVVKEEVSVSKRTVQGTERVSENVRKEDIKVEGDPNVKQRRK
jgi:uncharacterized protein (TIGR02271 family)